MKTSTAQREAHITEQYSVSRRRWLEWGVTLFATWFVIGLYLDGWAHTHNLPDTFFTPWHGVIYSGFLGAALVLISAALLAYRRGAPLSRVLPAGYGLALLGVGIFLIGGVGDLLWHTFLGIEASTDALYSPPHLLLAAGGFMIGTSALRATWHRPVASPGSLVRVTISLTIALGVLTFFSSEFHPFDHPWAWVGYRPTDSLFLPSYNGQPLMARAAAGGSDQDVAAALGIGSIIFQSGLLLALIVLAIGRWGEKFPLGWLTFVLTLSTLGLSFIHDTLWTLPAAVLTGILADVLYRWLRPNNQRRVQARIFATILPVILYSLYFLAMLFVGGTWWSIHLWTGAIVLAGVMGWLVSYAILPPVAPNVAQEKGTSASEG